MKFRPRVTIDLLLLIAGVVLLGAAAAAYVRGRERAFSGEIRIPADGTERVAVREVADGAARGAGVRAAEVPFEQAATGAMLGDDDKRYEYARLPYQLKIEETAVIATHPVRNELQFPHMKCGRIAVDEGGDITVGGESFTVVAIRKWAGLMREHTGVAGACVALSEDGAAWAENIIVAPGKWQALNEDVTIRFDWAKSAEAARAMLRNAPGLDAARWGIVDGNAVNWFHSFEPGMGLDLRGGGSVMLVEVDQAKPALHLEIRNKKNRRMVVVTPNSEVEPLVKFEHPAAAKHALRVAAWRDNAAEAAWFVGGACVAQAELEAGAVWKPGDVPWALRLDQAYEYAAPVKDSDSPLYEVVLRHGGKDAPRYVRVRQGEQATMLGMRVDYVRTAPPPVVAYTLAATAEDGKRRRFTVGPGDDAGCGDWVFEQVPASSEPMQAALLRVRHQPKRGVHTYLIAAGLVLIIWPLLHTLQGGKPAE